MIEPDFIRTQAIEAFDTYAQKGLDDFKRQYAVIPVISHICFKFADLATYHEYTAAAESLGDIHRQEFRNKEITWCRLHEPIDKNGLAVRWLEIVEPKFEANAFNGVTSIGYIAGNLDDVVKLPTGADGVVFRYQRDDVRPEITG